MSGNKAEEVEETEMLRHRKRDNRGWSPESSSEEKENGCTPSVYRFSTLLAAATVLCFWTALYSIAYLLNERLPELQHKNVKDVDRFVGERAKDFLIKLAGLGIKVPGSYELESQAVELFDQEIELIMKNANSFNQISYSKQKPSGSYTLAQAISFVSSYSEIQNLIVKIGPHDSGALNETSSLLVNCHYDSAPSSPGASDDGLNCAVMLEVLRILSQQNYTLQSHVVFLFNGAEETPLQASHGFITQHEWAKDVKAFINLESCGAGNKEALFQTGPKHPWLVQSYKEAAWHPFGLVLAEDLFQGGLVPSDTDFRIFRDFGHIPGLDFAHCDNGYVYHTRFDDIDRIRDGVFQHTGDNLLSLIRHITSSEMIKNPENFKEGRMIYFDLGGLYLVTYSETIGIVLNLIGVLLSVFIVVQNVRTYTSGMQKQEVVKQFIMCILVPALGLALALFFVVIIAVILDVTHSVLSWYSKPYLILPLYFSPTLIAFSLPPLLLNRIKSSNLCDGVRVQLYCNGVQLLWTVGLLIAIFTGLRSAYILLIAVIITSIVNCILTVFNLQYDVTKWLIGFCVSSVIPALYFVYLYILAMRLFIPIAGRSGPNINPEIIIGVLAALLSALIFAYITPLIILVWKPWRLVYGLLVVNIVTIFIIIVTPFGFPFAENTPQRLLVLHTSRSFYNETGGLIKNDSGMWLMHVDRRAPETYYDIPWFKDVKNVDSDCKNYLYCGLPFYYTRIASLERNPGSWVPASPPVIENEVSVKLTDVEYIKPDVKRFNFTVTGPHQMLLFLCPKEGVKLINWNVEKNDPKENLKWGSRPTFIIRFTAGSFPGSPGISFFIDLKIQSKFDEMSYLDFAVAGHYIEIMKKQEYQLMKDYTKSFLSWAHVTTWTAAYKSYIF